jgi:hypothetical protein
MDIKLLKCAALAAAALLLAGAPLGCNRSSIESSVEAAIDPRKPLDPITAHSAFNQMYRPIRAWAPDALPLTLVAEEIPGMINEGGRAAKWTGVFVSASRREARTAFFSALDQPGLQRGVTLAGVQSWSGATPKSRPFNPTQFFVDSDEAYKKAVEKAGAWLKTHPGKKLSLYLAGGTSNPEPVWVIMWGDTKSGYLAYINASSGKFMPNR